MNFKKYFESLKIIQKIQLYLIVLIFYSLIFFYYKDILAIFTEQKIIKNIPNITNSVATQGKISISAVHDLDLVNYIIQKSQEQKVQVNEYILYEKSIELNINSDFNDLISFLFDLEKNLYVESFEVLENDDTSLSTKIMIKKNYFYKSSKNSKSKALINSVFKNTIIKKKFIPKKLIVQAIIDDEVLINGNWYRLNDMINGNKIIKIGNRSIILFNIEKKKNEVLNYE